MSDRLGSLVVGGTLVSNSGPVPVQSPGVSSSATQTRPNNTDAYTAGDVVGTNAATNLSFADIGNVAGGHVIIMGAALRVDVNAVPSGMGTFVLHLYNAAPTAIADNAAYNLPSGDRAKYLGSITIPTPTDLGDTLYARADNLNLKIKLASASTTLYGILQTVAAYTPSAQTVKTVFLEGIQC